jgi:hypothetical protein
VLVAATFGLDLLWPLFSLMGLEWFRIDPGNTAFTPIAFDHYPWSHSLLMALVWSLLAFFLVRRGTGRTRDAWIVATLVTSHWVLDAVTHRPDLPLWPGASPMVGLGLWNSVAGTYLVEGVLFVAGAALYLSGTRPVSRRGTVVLWLLLVFLALAWVASPFSPPPPNRMAVTLTALAGFLIPAWAAWGDRLRRRPAGM